MKYYFYKILTVHCDGAASEGFTANIWYGAGAKSGQAFALRMQFRPARVEEPADRNCIIYRPPPGKFHNMQKGGNIRNGAQHIHVVYEAGIILKKPAA